MPLVGNVKPMSEDKSPIEPSEESLTEIPEQDFSRAIRPNRYANLRGAFQHAVLAAGPPVRVRVLPAVRIPHFQGPVAQQPRPCAV